MTEVEKAQELYFKYYMKVADGSFPEYNAKQCALIAVDEIIDALEKYDDINDTFELQNMDCDFRYWDKVKYELYKLKQDQ